MDKINKDEVAKKYNALQEIWRQDDKWHIYNFKRVRLFFDVLGLHNTYKEGTILNAGSGGESYGFTEENMHHFDIAEVNISKKRYFKTGTIEDLPYSENFFDFIICVGAVINYTDAMKAISEFSRVLKRGGKIALEFESSKSLELIFNEDFNRSSVMRKTFFQHKPEYIWYHSEDYIFRILEEYNLKIVQTERFHQLSILVYRLTGYSNFSAKFAWLDKIVKRIPVLKGYASNVILLAEKN